MYSALMKYNSRFIKTLFAFLLIIGSGFAYAGCTVNGTTVSGAISEANLDTAIGTGTDDITTCDVSSITDMSGLFHSKTSFNQDIGAWNTSNVTTMYQMFHSATNFNKDVSDWDTGKVTTMAQMFHSAVKFNNGGVALDWSDTSSVTTMSQMLHSNSKFNQDVSGWNTGNVTTMYEMFHSSSEFNNGGVALDWSDTSKVTTMYKMFHSNSAFNQSVSTWRTGSVTTMFQMFHSSGFNQSISTWDLSNVSNSTDMFNSAPYLSTVPTLTSSTPSDGATAVAVNSNIVLTFWKAVDVESGNITIKKSSDNSTVETIDVTGSKVTGTGTHTITINPSTTLDGATFYYLNIAATAFDDASSNSYAGITDATTLNFTTLVLSNPTLKKDVIGSIEAWSDISSRWADSSAMSAHNRIDWLTRNKGSNKTSHQGIQISFEDKTVDSIMNNSPTDALSDIDVTNTAASLIENSDGSAAEVSDNVESEASNIAINEAARLRESLIGSLNPSFGPVVDNWSMWTGGKVIVGNTDASTTASKKKVNFQAISIGFDKPIGNGDELMGFVLSIGQDDTDIGVSTTNVKSNNYSISNYTVFKPSDNTQIESVFGIGLLDFDTIRADGAGTLTGTRDANQLFFSSALRPLNNVNLGNWQVSPYSKVSLAETSLKAFSESGANTALTYAKQKVKDTSMGVGIDIYSQISNDSSTMKPYAKIEYNQSSSKTSASMHYNIENIALNTYTASLNKKNKNWKIKFGLDLDTNSGWDMSISYMREQSIGSSNDSKSTDNFSFNAVLKF